MTRKVSCLNKAMEGQLEIIRGDFTADYVFLLYLLMILVKGMSGGE
jgi:hypothetical protein